MVDTVILSSCHTVILSYYHRIDLELYLAENFVPLDNIVFGNINLTIFMDIINYNNTMEYRTV